MTLEQSKWEPHQAAGAVSSSALFRGRLATGRAASA